MATKLSILDSALAVADLGLKILPLAPLSKRPLFSGWQEAAEILYLRELLSVIAHLGPLPWALNKLRQTVQKFR